MKIKTFGKVSEIVPNDLEINSELNTIVDLIVYLENNFPSLKTASYIVAVNKQIVNNDHILREIDEIALLSPFSGG